MFNHEIFGQVLKPIKPNGNLTIARNKLIFKHGIVALPIRINMVIKVSDVRGIGNIHTALS